MIFEITKEAAGKEIKEFLSALDFSLSELRRLKKTDGITVNGETVTVRYTLKEGDRLFLKTEDAAPSEKIEPKNISPEIIYEDDCICLINKPRNMPVHPSQKHHEDTLANALAYYYRGRNFVFRAITRTDKDTSGITLIAKDRVSAAFLSKEMREGRIKKEYLAVTDGVPEEKEGLIRKKIGRKADSIIERECSENGEEAKTRYEVLAETPLHALVKVCPETGRTHQIRVHFADLGCPLTGDYLYGEESPDIKGQALHAYSLTFLHPKTKETVSFKAESPEDFKQLCKKYSLS